MIYLAIYLIVAAYFLYQFKHEPLTGQLFSGFLWPFWLAVVFVLWFFGFLGSGMLAMEKVVTRFIRKIRAP